MNKIQNKKWDYILSLDEELLKGGVIISEWATFLIKDADTAFCANANLAAILTSVAGIECHLRFEKDDQKSNLYDLIENSDLPKSLKKKLHSLRKYRNSWVHVNDPSSDSGLLEFPKKHEKQNESKAKDALKCLREVIYSNQWI